MATREKSSDDLMLSDLFALDISGEDEEELNRRLMAHGLKLVYHVGDSYTIEKYLKH